MTRTVSTAWQRGRKVVRPGDEIRVRGLGFVRFRQHVVLADGREWVDVVHPTTGFHSRRPEQVMSVSRKAHLRPSDTKAVAA